MNQDEIRNNLLEEIFLILGDIPEVEDICVEVGKKNNLELIDYLKTLRKKSKKKK